MAVPRLFGQPEWSGGVRSLSGDASGGKRQSGAEGTVRKLNTSTNSQRCVLSPVGRLQLLFFTNRPCTVIKPPRSGAEPFPAAERHQTGGGPRKTTEVQPNSLGTDKRLSELGGVAAKRPGSQVPLPFGVLGPFGAEGASPHVFRLDNVSNKIILFGDPRLPFGRIFVLPLIWLHNI